MSPHQELEDSAEETTNTMSTSFGPVLAMPAHQSPFLEGVSKHKTSDKRRAQNRAAQKTYREKRKRRLAELESLVVSVGLVESKDQNNSNSPREISPSPQSQQSQQSRRSQSQVDSQPSDLSLNQNLFEDQFSFDTSSIPTVSSKSPALTNSSTSPLQEDLSFSGLSSSDPSLFQDQFPFLDFQPTVAPKEFSLSFSDRSTIAPPTIELSDPQPNIFDFDNVTPEMTLEAVEAVDEEIIRSTEPASNALVPQTNLKLADPLANYLQLHTARVHWAFWHNSLHLGLGLDSCEDDSISQFYRPEASKAINSDAIVKSIRSTFSSIKPDLRPTKEQILVRHPGYLDILPFPDVRSRIIEIQRDNPGAFDEDEFWRDIEEENGIVCWGSIQVRPGIAPSGCGAPWDGRSWEAKMWFLTKWSFIVGNDESSLSRSSQWWREMRGVGQGFSF